MRRVSFLFLVSVVLLTVLPSPASGLNTGDTVAIIPIISRVPGVGGSQWRTDVFIANHSTVSKTRTPTFYQTIQSSDIFRFGIAPQADVQVEFNTSGDLIYGYASEVRNDTGDAIFVCGTSPNS
ncbi:MAG: hypothetical protein ABI718_15380 [Acidobacteriota bacterium]